MTVKSLAVAAMLTVAAAAPGFANDFGVATMSQGTLSFSTGSVIARVMSQEMGLDAVVQPNSGGNDPHSAGQCR